MSSTTVVRDMADTTSSSSSTVHWGPTDETIPRKSSTRVENNNNNANYSTKSIDRASDEATPIAKSDDHIDRSYNTSATTLRVQSSQNIPITNSVSQQSNASHPSHSDTDTDTNTSWWKSVAEKYGSVTLENKASVARDHLALERTFLAWLRTSLSFASIGIAITQLFRLNSSLKSSSTQSLTSPSHDQSSSPSNLPFSPFIGHAIPPEIIPYLQHAAVGSASVVPTPEVGPTLLDQMLGLTAEGASAYSNVMFAANTVGIETADKLRHVGKPLGATFIGISILVLLVGFQRYFEAQHWIIHGKFPASRGSISIVAFSACALVVASLVIIVVISPNQSET